MFKARAEVVLNLVIAGLVGVNLLIGFQLLTRGADPTVSAGIRSTTTVVSAPVEPEAPRAEPTTPGASTNVQQSLRNAAVTVQTLYLETGALPATAFELERSVPGLRIVDGVGRVVDGTIGYLGTPSSSLLVGTAGEAEWYCIAIDVAGPSIHHGRGAARDDVASFAACRGPADDWA